MKWLRVLAEKYLGRYREGVQPPERLSEMVGYFVRDNPRITAQEWAEFAAAHGNECYRLGYIRGREFVERDPDEWWPHNPTPEEIADYEYPNWKEAEPYDFGEVPEELPPREETETEALERHIEELRKLRKKNA